LPTCSSASRFSRGFGLLVDAVTVDVSHTVSVSFVSGIQRVVRETARRWQAAAEDAGEQMIPVGWTPQWRAMRSLTTAERQALLGDGAQPVPADERGRGEVIVPWRGVHVVAELTAEPQRTERMQAMGASATELAFIGYDCIPITSGETVTPG